jgi:cytochrome c biogenesis protein CcmG/thiol:disulfide interchange protein DsbE
MMKRAFASLLLCAVALCVPSMKARASRVAIEGDAVSLNLKGLDGQTYNLEAMRGNVLLVSFGATWCQPCVAELRALEELKKEYRTKPVKILWVNIEGTDEISDKGLRDYVKQQKLTFPVLRDTGKLTYAQFSTRVRIPLVVFFDKNGNVARPVQFGMATPELYKSHVRERLDKLLAAQEGGNASRAQ